MGWTTIPIFGAERMERLVDGVQSGELYWNPISSAPKDGQMVILVHEAKPDCVIWRAMWDDTTDGNAPISPTHWMPDFLSSTLRL